MIGASTTFAKLRTTAHGLLLFVYVDILDRLFLLIPAWRSNGKGLLILAHLDEHQPGLPTLKYVRVVCSIGVYPCGKNQQAFDILLATLLIR